MAKRYTRADGEEVYEGEYVEVVEGEIVEPDGIDHAFDLARQLNLLNEERAKQLMRQLPVEPDPDLGRSIVAAIGGAAGANFKGVGAATGAGLGALLYDFVMDSLNPGRSERRSVDKRIKKLRGKE